MFPVAPSWRAWLAVVRTLAGPLVAAVAMWAGAQEGPGPAPLAPTRSGPVAGPSGGLAGVAGSSNAVPDLAALSRHLVGHWRLDEQHGLRAADASGKGNHGMLANFPRNSSHRVPGRIGGGLNFNSSGVSNHVVAVPDSAVLNFTNGLSFTLSVWVRSLAPQVSGAGILCKMHARFTDGHSFLNTSEFSYGPAEEWVTHFTSKNLLTKWLVHQGPFQVTNN